MTLANFFAKMKLSQKDAEVIFDRNEPVGKSTDLVMPWRPLFRRRRTAGESEKRSAQTQSLQS
jgi:hypothetical protein